MSNDYGLVLPRVQANKAIEGAAMLAGAVGMGVAAFFDPALIASPIFDKIWAGLIMGGISMEAGAIADALTSNRGMTITTRQPAGLRQIIYGERRVGGTMVYESTTGSHHDQYNHIIALAGHEVDSIENLYLDGRQVFWLGSGAGNTTRNGVNFGGVADGSDHVGPDGTTYNFGGTGHSGLYCEARWGDQTAGDVIGAMTANDTHWAAGVDGSPYMGGCAYVYLKIEDNASLFPSLPEMKFTVRGKNDIYDPRTGTRGYSNNWALIVADIITNTTFGLGDSSVNEDQLIAAANVCDEMVDLAIGGGAQEKRYTCNWMTDTSTAPGDMLQTVMQGAAGRLSRIGGEWYIWPAYWQGPTFEWDESILTDRVQWQPNRPFRELCNRVQGTYIAANFPYNQLDTGGIANLYDSNGWFDGHIDNTFPYAFQPTNYPQYAQDTLHGYSSDALLAEDGGILLPLEITQATVLSISQAQRVAKIMLLRNRQQGSGTLSMHLKAAQMQPLSVFTMDFARLGWASKVLEVNKVTWSCDKDANGVPTVRLQMGVNETAASVYEWATSEELSAYDVPSSPTQTPGTPDPPASLTLLSNSSTGVTSIDGIFSPRILASWTAPPDVLTQYIQIQHQLSGAAGWIDDGSVDAETTAVYISGVVGGDTYNVRIRGVRGSGATSNWVETDGCAVPTTASSIASGSLPVATGSTGGIVTVGAGLALTGGVLSVAGGGSGSTTMDILSPEKPTGTLAYQKNEFASVAAGATINLLNYSGGSPGYVDWVTLQLKDTGGADPSNMTVNIYYDGSGTPAISCPLQNFFMATYAILNGPTAISSCFHGFTSNHSNSQVSFYFRLPIPFTTGIKIDIVNTTAQSFNIWSACEYQVGVPNTWAYTRKLHVDTTQQSGLAANSVNTLVNYSGGAKGRFVGLWLLEDDFPGSVTPHGAPLEGNINLYLDGSGTESAQSSGTEDWFGGGFYFAGNGTGGTGGGNSSQVQAGYKDGSGQIGVTYMSATAFLTEGAFRFHVSDKRYFNSGLKLTWQCGDTSEIPFTGTGTIFTTVFYYTES